MAKPRTRTLKNGERVLYHPDGTQQLLPSNSLQKSLAATDAVDRAAEAALTDARMAAVDAKRDSLASGDAVPEDKRVI